MRKELRCFIVGLDDGGEHIVGSKAGMGDSVEVLGQVCGNSFSFW